ncbi:DUF948 domain-containing protein [Sphaerimonospora cavernae]|uniref:DUF948 domain-containing protein n=1 Tax=Sphaerimonospora cavernae TaxID=1740611 RepID=A0ABV6U8W3_9ACTN
MSAGELAGMLVAVFWAILVCFLAVVLVKLTRLLNETTKSVAELSERLAPLLDDMGRTVSEANRRLVETEAITDNARTVSGDLVRITGVASALFATPLIKISALGHGLRAAVAARRGGPVSVPAPRRGDRSPARRGRG